MELQILSTIPADGNNDVTIDTNIVINFNQAIDKFTVDNGVSLYIMNSDGTYDFLPYSSTILGSRLTLIPTTLFSNKTHYLTILPGNDPSRFLSTETVSDPIYTRIGASTGTVSPLSYFKGTVNTTYTLLFGANSTVDITKGLSFLGTFDYSDNVNIGDSDLSFSTIGQFDIGDEVTLGCFKATGVTSIYKVSFDTTKYTTITPGSIEITDESIAPPEELFIVDTIPENLSTNNIKCNPIVIKFNKDISTSQDLLSKIKITKSDVLGSNKRNVEFEYTTSGNILKIYLKSIGNPVF